MRVLSWNVLKGVGAGAAAIAGLIGRHRPNLVLLQEATEGIDALPSLVDGHYVRRGMDGRGHGLAAWSPAPFEVDVTNLPLATRFDLPSPFRAIRRRIAMLIRIGPATVANVHLDHGQFANRRQLRHVVSCAGPDVIMGDFNAIGATGLPGYADVGPRCRTHWAHGMVPVRLDRCLSRLSGGTAAVALGFGKSDHRPILVDFCTTSRLT